ncbi:hypothetical protein BOTNAR_0037g00280 [Botryotinia narcissicola]|uniref:Uncharacterized protein n=1 Tax=Botryotinia narcissicola TaxID=278944 RepID=A0A4Z1J284_9HELO|nr:hypothetical protein BOTNAR_0037g00280 [Botryotinia narcissicola]
MTGARTNLDGFRVPELGFPLLLLIIINTEVALGRNGDYRENADVGLYVNLSKREIQVSIMPIE